MRFEMDQYTTHLKLIADVEEQIQRTYITGNWKRRKDLQKHLRKLQKDRAKYERYQHLRV